VRELLAIRCMGLLAPSAFAHETEITMTGTLHGGLRALQRETGTESLHHSEISVAMEQITELGEAELFVELRVPFCFGFPIFLTPMVLATPI
jgi:hypothetical protein